MSLVWSAGVSILINAFPAQFFGLFNADDQFIMEGIPVLAAVTSGMLGMSLASVWMNAVVGTGQTKFNLGAEVLSIVVYVAYTWYVVNYLGASLAVAWLNELIYWIFIFAMCATYMYSNRWRKVLATPA